MSINQEAKQFNFNSKKEEKTIMNIRIFTKVTYGVSKALIAASPIIVLSALDANAAFDLDAGVKAATDPLKNMINTYYPVGLFVAGVTGAFLQPQRP